MLFEQLQQARALEIPSREAMLHRDLSVQQFWHSNKALLSNAWQEWQESEGKNLGELDDSLLDEKLRNAVQLAWQDPTKEQAVQDLWQEVAPNVFECQFFNPERLTTLRTYLERVWDAEIPLRPPYGIVLNRRGAMLDSRSEGYLAAPDFQSFYRELINAYLRPIARLLFPEITGYDTQSFGFSIHYQPGTDTSIRPHTDASAVTLNINLNTPEESFSGSAVNFYNPHNGQINEFTFKPGTAVIHRGHVAHAAQPITSGSRSNFVLWLYGNRGQMPPASANGAAVDAKQRWTQPNTIQDNFAPF